ncbi:MAG: hypothetical protein GY853_14260 [PVC group bacterium]|nr:hypothetical protein [PVC group bacterium]
MADERLGKLQLKILDKIRWLIENGFGAEVQINKGKSIMYAYPRNIISYFRLCSAACSRSIKLLEKKALVVVIRNPKTNVLQWIRLSVKGEKVLKLKIP